MACCTCCTVAKLLVTFLVVVIRTCVDTTGCVLSSALLNCKINAVGMLVAGTPSLVSSVPTCQGSSPLHGAGQLIKWGRVALPFARRTAPAGAVGKRPNNRPRNLLLGRSQPTVTVALCGTAVTVQ